MSERRSELKAVAASEDLAANQPGRDLFRMSVRMMDGWTQVNGRLISLAQTSMRNNLAAAEELRNCQSPAEMVEAQMRLTRQVYDQYVEESRKIAELMTQLSGEAMGVMALPR
ncbi:phasin family protein [Magnetospirillum sp. UT-4]|uniref:phasin family protein n=1 Tax=Magnetospirillum sp. UT-4 TaxID=2681467 RepID=UPI001383FB00|nr:phasin family protein [Magnetospirillum sp. UT-4]CAA7618541.1 hypothetical protein MTBUT4_30094 [Magnetospirillum sp. UT-4]